MKMMAKSGCIMVMVCCFLAAFSPVWAADPSTQLGKDNVLQKTTPNPTTVETKVISCAKEITVQARLSDSYLQSSIDASAKSTNYNDVVLIIYASNAFGDFNVDCYSSTVSHARGPKKVPPLTNIHTGALRIK
jgi:hypothetical protein